MYLDYGNGIANLFVDLKREATVNKNLTKQETRNKTRNKKQKKLDVLVMVMCLGMCSYRYLSSGSNM